MSKKNISLLVIGIVAIIAGAVILNYSGAVIQVFLVIAGIGALLSGYETLKDIKKWNFQELTKTLSTIKAVETALLGLAAVIIGLFFVNTALTVMIYIFAAGLVFSSVVSFENAAVASKFGAEASRSRFISEAVISLLVAIILFFKPLETIYTVFKVIGIVIIVVGSLMIAGAVISMIKAKKAEKDLENATVVEFEVEDEKKD